MAAGAIVAGPLVRLACKRHLADLKRGYQRGLRFDAENAGDAIAFFEQVLTLPETEGLPFLLEPWQCFIIGSLFGWKSAEGYRRFRTAYIETGKGSGKSPMSAGVGLLGLVADGEQGAQIYSAATTRDQAKILFRDAEIMVASSPLLRDLVHRSVNNLAVYETASFFRPISAEHRGLDGKRPHFVLADEVHEHPSAIVLDKMRAGTKGRKQALIFEITNSGWNRHSICWHHHEYSRQILEAVVENDSWFAYVCGLDEGDDYRDRKVWLKANPNLGVSIPMKYLEEQVAEAAGIPSKENIVKRLNFCIWTEQSERWLPMEVWDACEGPALEALFAELLGQDCYGGLDLASTTDLCSLCLVFPPAGARTKWAALWWFWLPGDSIQKRSERDHVPYDVWVRQKLITVTPGNITDYEAIRRALGGTYFEGLAGEEAGHCHDDGCIADKFNIIEIGYDPHNATGLVTQLTGDGLLMVPIRQGFLSLNAPTKELERLLLGRQLQHGGNAVARWNLSNCATNTDSAGNIKLDKDRSTEKIDGMAAAVDAIARAQLRPPTRYTSPEVVWL